MAEKKYVVWLTNHNLYTVQIGPCLPHNEAKAEALSCVAGRALNMRQTNEAIWDYTSQIGMKPLKGEKIVDGVICYAKFFESYGVLAQVVPVNEKPIKLPFNVHNGRYIRVSPPPATPEMDCSGRRCPTPLFGHPADNFQTPYGSA